ncbi:MAG: serine/threonine protein kinase [Magnetococcales bacterium]|nr:serine/threonine protein kinase [Magnetococcales bacterium]MBF0148797.1 serine/threonine protein kinase [Magnetococcales bacterium]MBF0173397.1 serine/threonine protein kinase [Magnetococcales bacterium]MBF0346478.1 serine/threonine protein kinase [Magnetococcales bacterium]
MGKKNTAHLPLGSVLHGYKLLRVLGAGGFGITYLAYDKNLGREVAIKEFFPKSFVERRDDVKVVPKPGSNEELLRWGMERFTLEGQTLAQFKHPAIVGVIHFFQEYGTAYLVMEYIIGDSLPVHIQKHKTWFRGIRFTTEELFRFIRHLCSGLELIHDAGIIHRDIKPDNIIIRPGGIPVLLDFGAARQTMMDRNQDRRLTVIATPANAPPEQFMEDGEQGPWTDIYALGTVLYHMLTGTSPPSSGKRIQELTSDRPDPLVSLSQTLANRYPARLLNAIDQALIIDLKKRPGSVREWLNSLRAPGDTRQSVTGNAASPHPVKGFARGMAMLSDGWKTQRRCLFIGFGFALMLQPVFYPGWRAIFLRTHAIPSSNPPMVVQRPSPAASDESSQDVPTTETSQDIPTKESLFALTIVTEPKDAKVRILNITPKYQPGMKLPKADYHLEVSADRHRTVRQWITLDAMDKNMTVTLQPE